MYTCKYNVCQILAATVNATMQTAPRLRDSLLAATQTALGSMAPLSLCPASHERPAFLSQHVLTQIASFIRDIAV